MVFCNIKNPPEYSTEIRKWDRETLADGQEMAVEIEQLFNNTFYNKMVQEQHEQLIEISIPASGWSNTAPYSQRVAVAGIKATENPVLSTCTPKNLEPATVKLRRKMTGMITDGETEDGYVTFYCGEKKPTEDFCVYLRGVSANG
ncbi:hypothetical protein DS742_05145 [Lacrimispora amygdalina]|uniref:Uncharacterized protein n=1 Tax=Lacrimispora amygdalina TaxID=253257 RepID=A0A3E2NFP6_9FIRM|nr:hypothetical protein [Clostridium indicum]RFZ79848.1 hypothetical protein DS742_05145 [Clostridium indicum]